MCLHHVCGAVSMLSADIIRFDYIFVFQFYQYMQIQTEDIHHFGDDLNMRHIQIDGGSVTAFQMICATVTFSGICRVHLTSHEF